MELAAGTRLGPYEIVALIGRGGMGDVYRARDTRLNRDVALKLLPDAFAADAERLARFVREAQTLAALNHPRIAHVHGLEETPHGRALVMELVEGETLANRLEASAANHGLAVEEALAIARQLAEALQAAHEKGIVHRDLKPANIMVTADGQVKVLDFGLAKALDPVAGDTMNSPTLTLAATRLGVILGTAAYMSPEQAKGRAVDKRTDIWAFGCVLYEMLTGRRAFEGEDVTETIAAIVRGEPAWNALPEATPAQIRVLLNRCLEKDRRARVPDIGVATFLLTESFAAAPRPATGAASPRFSRRVLVSAALGIATAIALLAAAVRLGTTLVPARDARPARFTYQPPTFQSLASTADARDLAVSPDGAFIVYRAGALPVMSELAVRALNELQPRLLPASNAREPFVSADNQWIGFFIAGEMRKISISGGPPITICKAGFVTRGATWSDDGLIVFATGGPETGLMSVSANGGEPQVLTVPDRAKGEAGHLYPSFLPGGRFVLFTIAATGALENAQIAVLDLKTGERKTLIRGGSDAAYASSGHLVYASGGSLRAVRFDRSRLEAIGDSAPVVDQVMTSAGGRANYAMSRQGTLVYVAAEAAQSAPRRTLAWVDRQGHEEPFNAPPRAYAVGRLSPDDSRVALDIRDQGNDIWIWSVGRQTLTPLNLHPAPDMSPLWTPDGRRVIWSSNRGGGNPNLYRQSADGSGVIERLTTSDQVQFATSISADGSRLVLFGGLAMPTSVSLGISVLDVDRVTSRLADRRTVLQSSGLNENPEISPDGRWLAYQSNESGQFQIYVRPFPNFEEGRWQISSAGGTRPMWERQGRELFFLDGDDYLTAVAVQTNTGTFSPGTARRILQKRYYTGFTSRGYDLRAFDISSDGRRFLMIKRSDAEERSAATPLAMTVVLNWFEELETRLPAGRP